MGTGNPQNSIGALAGLLVRDSSQALVVCVHEMVFSGLVDKSIAVVKVSLYCSSDL